MTEFRLWITFRFASFGKFENVYARMWTNVVLPNKYVVVSFWPNRAVTMYCTNNGKLKYIFTGVRTIIGVSRLSFQRRCTYSRFGPLSKFGSLSSAESTYKLTCCKSVKFDVCFWAYVVTEQCARCSGWQKTSMFLKQRYFCLIHQNFTIDFYLWHVV